MNILITAATEFEIEPFLQQHPGTEFLITGVGAPMAVYQLAKRLIQTKYDLVIQAGIAGSFLPSLEPGRIVFVNQDCFADLGISEQHNISTLFEKGFADPDDFPFSDGWLKNPESIMDVFPIEKVTGITVNTITDNLEMINHLSAKFKPAIETMEGAALHYVCLQEKISFLQVRSVSNDVGERNKSKWKMKEAVENLNATLLNMVGYLARQNLKS
ncbi:MAG: futalosine hydrolase [Ferruginibacter sp.]